MAVYYNENDPFCVAWLRELIKQGAIADGEVDSRSIGEVRADDLAGFSQCHFFAGIGGWSYALRLAGWSDERPVWTGSCPCQPFSVAGKRKGSADERHLWPEFARLIDECQPSTVFGEQVASKDGRAWLATVRNEMEAMGYALGAADLCAAGVGAPHIRQRLYWGAQRLGNAGSSGGGRNAGTVLGAQEESESQRQVARCFPNEPVAASADPWSDCDWLPCSDGVARPAQSGTFPLAHGAPARVGRLRGYGNAIVPQVAATFVEAFDEFAN